jgi:hypothetical protein
MISSRIFSAPRVHGAEQVRRQENQFVHMFHKPRQVAGGPPVDKAKTARKRAKTFSWSAA